LTYDLKGKVFIMPRLGLVCVVLFLCANVVRADNVSEEYKLFRGHWQITELVEDGRVIAPEAIQNMFPSGGRVEIIDNTILFTSQLDGKKRTKTITIDPSTYPKVVAVSTRDKTEGWGIYQFDKGRLVMCITDPAVAQRPTDFSSRSESKRMMMTLERSSEPKEGQGETGTFVSKPVLPPPPAAKPAPSAQPAPPATPQPSAATARVLTDAEVLVMLRGTWKFNDGQGVLNVTMKPDGTYFSTREVLGANTFHQVFIPTPVSNGTWSVTQGQLKYHVTSSIYADRVNQAIPLSVRSVSQTDLIFVDYLGRMGRAVKSK
jgi:uncharacterized protein (TIGR03067 family)